MIKNIEITEQTNENECGICVIKTLIKYFYNKNVTKEELYQNANFDDNGLSIWSFEELAMKYGIKSDSYEISYQEIINKQYFKPFVALIMNEYGLHYVIVKKNKNAFIIFDSNQGKYILSYEDFEKIFQNIIILVEKNNIKIELNFNLKKIIDCIDWKSFLITNFINCIIVILSIFGGLYMNNLIDHVINNKVASNLISINLIFLILFIVNNLLNLFVSHFAYINKISYFNLINFKIMNILSKCNKQIFLKNNFNDLININDHIMTIAEFYTQSINKIICDTLTLIVTLILLSITNLWTLLLILAVIMIAFIFNYFYYLINRESTIKNYQISEEYTNTSLNFFNHIKYNHYNKKKILLKHKLIHISQQQNNLNYKINFKEMLLNFFANSAQIIFFLILIAMNILNLFNHQSNLGKIFFIISLFQLFNSSLNNLLSFYMNFPKIKYSKELLSRILNEKNEDNTLGITIDKVKNIIINQYCLYNDSLIIGPNGSGKTTILKSLISNFEKFKIKINDIDFQLIASKWIKDNYIYVDHNYTIDENDVVELLNSKYQQLVIDIINLAKIKSLKDQKSWSVGQRQILSFLSLLMLENKVLCVDELLSCVDCNFKIIIMQKIKPILIENNFLIMVEHDQNIYSYFSNLIEVKDVS